MKFILQHTHLGFCWLDLVALIVLLLVIGLFVYQHRKLKKVQEELEDELSVIYADQVEQNKAP